uniref:transmembrane protein 164-like n=1 Tax=Styela clava TaxID=7725 RepID=UPI00193AAFCE|nr:transmembrane protein 164-like [Styela clava]
MEYITNLFNPGGKEFYADWLYGGVNFSIGGNGGAECAKYLSVWTRSTETIFIILLSIFEVIWAFQKLTFEGHTQGDDDENSEESSRSAFHLSSDRAPVALDCVVHSVKKVESSKDKDPWPWMKRALLVLLCTVFGIEIGYKFATKSIIYLLNPCHMLTFTQIYLLASDHQKKCKTLNTVFRVHLYLLNGALLAMIFYVVNTRFLPFEQAIYWIQHVLLYLIPVYLISLGGSYTPDTFSDLRWSIFSIGCGFIYHFTLLQGLAMITQTNLNNMLCPAVSDPFEGQHYRKWATAHQHAMIILHGKVYVFLARALSRILAAVQSFCVAVTLKMWRWTIHLCLASARAYVRVCTRKPGDAKTDGLQENVCAVQKSKVA